MIHSPGQLLNLNPSLNFLFSSNIFLLLQLVYFHPVRTMRNQIMSTPQIVCAEKGIVFEMETSHPFKGQLYVKNEYRNPKCRASFKNEKSENFGGGNVFQLNFNECGMRRQRMATPKGLSYSVTMVVQFHNTFVTSADKAYQIRCFYREYAMEVTAEQMNISPLTTVTMALDHPLPRCSYTIKYKSMDGPAASFVTIGDPVVHLFACDADDTVYRMLIKECYVDDGKEHKQKIIDNGGCTMDSDIVETPKYVKGQLKAFAEATVFKWPDEPSIYFSCQLTLCMVEDGSCLSVSPPRCGDIKRAKRSSESLNVTSDRVIPIQTSISAINPPGPLKSFDLEVQKLIVLDLEEKPDNIYMDERRHYFNNTDVTEAPKATTKALEFHTVPESELEKLTVPTTVSLPTTKFTEEPVVGTTKKMIPRTMKLTTTMPTTQKISETTTIKTVMEPATSNTSDDKKHPERIEALQTTTPKVNIQLNESEPRIAIDEQASESVDEEISRLNKTINSTLSTTNRTNDEAFSSKSNQKLDQESVKSREKELDEEKQILKNRINQQHQERSDLKREFIHETLSRNRDLFGGKYCYGPEIVISFAVVVSILAVVLLVLTGRMLGPVLKRRCKTENKNYQQQQLNNPYYTNSAMTYPI